MDAERWRLVREIFAGMLERGPGEQGAYLETACAGDPELRAEVESLLEADRGAGRFLSRARVPVLAGEEAADPMIGRRLGPYEVREAIGRGGMGTVYEAVRIGSDFEQRVAVKLLKRGMDSDEIVRRFRTERRILASLDHPHIAHLLDGGSTEDGLPYFVMEHVDGRPIDEYCVAHGLTVRERLELFRDVCGAVQLAHRNLVVHRDLKPSNILVTADGQPKLLDFGIAKLLDPEAGAGSGPPTRPACQAMTPDYASPEQLAGGRITTASDVYSLGLLLYVLLTGRHPFGAALRSPAEMLWTIRNRLPEAPSRVVARALGHGLGGDLDSIVLKALNRAPARRYASVEQLSDDVRRHLEGLPVTARESTFVYRAGKFARRHRLGLAAAAAIFAMALGFGGVMAAQRQEIARERDRVELERQRAEVERRRAESVTAFLVDLFGASDPFGEAGGREVTARELLERGAGHLALDLAGEPEERAELSHTIGVIHRRLGLLDEAAPFLAAAVETRRDLLGPEHPKLADSLHEQALLWREQGDYVAAEAQLRQALDLRLRRFGGAHPAVADSLVHLAAVIQDRGDFRAAEPLLRRALGIRGASPEAGGGAVAESLHQLALNLKSQGDYEGAEPLFREAVALYQRLHGEGHAHLATTRANLAHLLFARGDLDEAEVLYRGALSTLRRTLGDGHVEVGNTIHSLASVLAARGDLEEAEPLFEQALVVLRSSLGATHPNLAFTLGGLAGVRRDTGDLATADRLYRQALTIRRQALGDAHPYVAVSLTSLAGVLVARDDCAAAEPLLREAVAIGRAAFPGGHWRIHYAETVLGDCLTRAARYPEAEPLLRTGYEALSARKGPSSRVASKAFDRLLALYRAWGRPDEVVALEERRRALAPVK